MFGIYPLRLRRRLIRPKTIADGRTGEDPMPRSGNSLLRGERDELDYRRAADVGSWPSQVGLMGGGELKSVPGILSCQ